MGVYASHYGSQDLKDQSKDYNANSLEREEYKNLDRDKVFT